ncbi:MAG: hypothetical protein PVI21_00320 [Candidatus Woesebacteria bacterium]|jgi:hypothetical protein
MHESSKDSYDKPISHLLTAQLGLAEGLMIAAETAAKNKDVDTISDLIDYLISSVFILDYIEIDFVTFMREYFDTLINCVKNDLDPIRDKETMRARNVVVEDMIEAAARYDDPTYTLWSSPDEYNGLLANFELNQATLSRPYKDLASEVAKKPSKKMLWFFGKK